MGKDMGQRGLSHVFSFDFLLSIAQKNKNVKSFLDSGASSQFKIHKEKIAENVAVIAFAVSEIDPFGFLVVAYVCQVEMA